MWNTGKERETREMKGASERRASRERKGVSRGTHGPREGSREPLVGRPEPASDPVSAGCRLQRVDTLPVLFSSLCENNNKMQDKKTGSCRTGTLRSPLPVTCPHR